MGDLISLLFGFPTVVYTVFLGFCLFYWLLVVIGLADIDGLHVDVDLDADGLLGAAASTMSLLGLKGVPFTLILTSLVFWAWFLTALGAIALLSWLPGLLQYLLGAGLLIAAAIGAFFITRYSLRPLQKLFVPQGEALSARGVVGQVCLVSSGTVDGNWGEARLLWDGADLVLRVHTRNGERLSKGDAALILDYDETADRYAVTLHGDGRAAAS